MNIEDQSCLLCGSNQGKVIQNSLRDVEEGLPGSYSISQCCRCGFIFLSRRPAAASVAQCYGHGYHASAACRCQGFTGWLYDLRCYLRFRQIKATVRLGEVFDPGDLSVSLCNALVTKCRWLERPRQLKIYIPPTLAVTPLVALQNLMADSGEMLFVAKLSSK